MCGNPACLKYATFQDNIPFHGCVKCKSMFYCSKECQTADWAVHKQNCITMKKSPEYPKVDHKKCKYHPCYHEIFAKDYAGFIWDWKTLFYRKNDAKTQQILDFIDVRVTESNSITKVGCIWIIELEL